MLSPAPIDSLGAVVDAIVGVLDAVQANRSPPFAPVRLCSAPQAGLTARAGPYQNGPALAAEEITGLVQSSRPAWLAGAQRTRWS
jgi:hypothetical protein